MELPYQTTPYSADARRRHTFDFDFQTSAKQQRMRDPVDLASLPKKTQHGRAPCLKIACLAPTGTGDESKCDWLTRGGITQVSCVWKIDSDAFAKSSASLGTFCSAQTVCWGYKYSQRELEKASVRTLFNLEGCQTGCSRSACYKGLIALGING